MSRRRLLALLLSVGLTGQSVAPAAENPLRNRHSPVPFVDVTTSAGIDFLHRNSATSLKYLIETMTGGVAVFDYDNDGWLDVFFVNGARLQNPQPDGEPLEKSSPEFWNRLYRNNRDGSFRDVTEASGLQGSAYGMGAATGDYDNDGDVDLLVTNYGPSALYRNNADGTFTDVTKKAGVETNGWATSAGFLDYDGDGCLDLFVCRYLRWDFRSGSRFCGHASLDGGRAYCHPDEFPPISNYLFRNNCDGTFTDASAASGIGGHEGKALGVAFADYNQDGFLDISVANDSHQQFLFENSGDGTFAEVGLGVGIGYDDDGQAFAGMGTDFADVDNDGRPDIITTALPYQFFAYFRNLGGIFTYSSMFSNLGAITRLFSGWGMRVFDYDCDGVNDLFVANSHVMDNIELTQPHISYRQRPLLLTFSEGKFIDVSGQAGEVFDQQWAARGAAFGDLDNDGDVDVVVSTCNGPAHLLRNQTDDRNNWLTIELRGRKSNRQGIGAHLKLTTGSGKEQYRLCSTAGSYLSANDPRVTFGLGSEEKIRELRIRWPSGSEQVIENPQPNRTLKVEEPQTESRP